MRSDPSWLNAIGPALKNPTGPTSQPLAGMANVALPIEISVGRSPVR
jgi:hypothetical protein